MNITTTEIGPDTTHCGCPAHLCCLPNIYLFVDHPRTGLAKCCLSRDLHPPAAQIAYDVFIQRFFVLGPARRELGRAVESQHPPTAYLAPQPQSLSCLSLHCVQYTCRASRPQDIHPQHRAGSLPVRFYKEKAQVTLPSRSNFPSNVLNVTKMRSFTCICA